MRDEDLESLYLSAVYEVELPAGIVGFRIGERLHGRPFALITAHNPGRERPSAEENARANERLKAEITAAGYEFAPGRGRASDDAHVEPSFAVFDTPFEVARQLAKEFGQAAFVWSDGETTTLVWTDERAGVGAT